MRPFPFDFKSAPERIRIHAEALARRPLGGSVRDRGPYADRKRRIIDLSRAAANSIGLVEQGVGPARMTVTDRPAEAQKISADEETYFEVQVGAFEDGAEAQSVLSQVQSRFEKAYIAPREGPAGEHYRVRIGPFKRKAYAQRIANALKRGGHYVFLDEIPESAVAKDNTPER